jgi:D-alanyl-D-alanine carboxypeptidase/D-alanyl-D-alanine-endopeptidase (penicillin-binding protein 4)
MLEARGIVVTGKVSVQHRISTDSEGFISEVQRPLPDFELNVNRGYGVARSHCFDCGESKLYIEKLVANHTSPSLKDDLTITNKVSQNLHAELLLRHLSMAFGDEERGSVVQGARVVRQFLLQVGIDKDDFVFFDGSGLSGHDLVTPRATAQLLQYALTQPWFEKWKTSLPVGGEDGSLAERFGKAPLKDHVFAKTGTLGEARALSGYLECASGRTVIFSIMVGNHPPGTSEDREAMDKIVAAIAAAN